VIARLLAIVLGLALGAGAWTLSQQETLSAPVWLQAWVEAHPDPRSLGPERARAHAEELGRAYAQDGQLLLLGLAAACLAWGLLPLATRRGAGRWTPLAAGGLVLGVFSAAASAREQAELSARGRWTLGDDALAAAAGLHADTLRGWRERIPEGDVVIVVGTQAQLFNLTAWVLFPRPIRLVPLPVAASVTGDDLAQQARALPAGADGPARWLVDLASLAAGPRATRPALQRLLP